jgi:hypothetical protein
MKVPAFARSARPLRALALAGIGIVTDGLHAAGCMRAADFAIRLREPLPRAAALLFLALARLGRLRVWPGHLETLSRILSPADFLPIVLRSPRPCQLTRVRFTAGDDPAADTKGTKGRVLMDYDYFNPECAGDTVVAPFALHPHYYASGMYRELASYRGRARTVRLFFAGTSEADSYSQQFANDLFGVMNRSEVLAAVLEDFPDDTLIVRRREDFQHVARSGRPIVLVLTNRTEDNLDKHVLRPREYLRMQSRSAFALCPPGWAYPHCHNLIETMAVGTVPVLPYASFCHPPLTGGANCLTFCDRDTLRSAVRTTLSLPGREAARLGAAAASHFDTELSVRAFASRLAHALKRGGDVRIRFPFGAESLRLRRQPI